MSDPSASPSSPAEALYSRANQLVMILASKADEGLMREARDVAAGLMKHVQGQVQDYAEFVKRVETSEEYSLTEARQVPKTERELRTFYLRAVSLNETVAEAEARARKKR